MTKRDPMTGMTDHGLAALADSVRQQAADPSLWEDVTVEVSPDMRSVVAVHFRRGELADIERAAGAAGQLLAAYIRWAQRPQPGLGVRHGSRTHLAHVRASWCNTTPRVV